MRRPATRRESLIARPDTHTSPGGLLRHMRIGLTKSCDLIQQDAWKDLENQWRDLPRAA
jgi:hypothetical protein